MYTTLRQRGFNTLAGLLALSSLLLIAAVVFGVWAFANMLDYKNNSDKKVAAAVLVANKQEDAVKDAAFAEQIKLPLTTYTGPASYGSVTIKYPKTWSGYVIDTRSGSPFVDGYFYPGTVPDTQSSSSVFALRVQVVQSAYSVELGRVTAYVKQGLTTVAPYAAPKVPSVVGSRIDGKLPGNNKNGSMVLLPLRNMALEIWTEAPQFQNDFNNNILPNFTFAP